MALAGLAVMVSSMVSAAGESSSSNSGLLNGGWPGATGTDAKRWPASPQKDADLPPVISGPRDLLQMQGIDQSHFDLLTDGLPWKESENEVLLKILYRLHRDFRLMDVEAWSRGHPEPDTLAKNPDAWRGEIFQLAGRVVSIDLFRPAPEEARRFELNEYYRCRLVLADARQPALVYARTIPQAWKGRKSVDARAGGFAVFLKTGSQDPTEPLPIFVASRLAWYPPTRLGDLGMDHGLFDDLRPRERLTGRNRECFYQMLAAVGRSKPGELLAEASQELQRTGQDRFSVVPLFNQPQKQHGRLVVLSGTARQVIPIRVSDEDVVSRFGIQRYYQIFLFTEDSQGNPLAFCVRELPEGMPTGEGAGFGEYVTVAGFFFNTWAYRNRRSGDPSAPQPQGQLAPLLIGRDLKWLPRPQPAANPFLGAIAGALFVLAILGIWLALWRNSRQDKQFRQTTIARRFAPDPAASLGQIGLDAPQGPDFSRLGQVPESESRQSIPSPDADQGDSEQEVSGD